ncbi:EAL domain-containing protein [Pseudoalteromonas shioyasakiensis]|uniref:bifunctional diguanylate cyclase/phosphodiesterase n=1 Tax=Pseudoalteromonas shioyasakiensis TaxID=1190813 RepID=UPI002117B218|nr:EAL domain-containing protein [Pseudoalteromonas shioyasakiensis]MCQ8879970.1 EAL domain-containing protein [Pseudoalteromonas shioyasakiensis]
MQALALAEQLAAQQTNLLDEIEHFTIELAKLDAFSSPLQLGCPDYLSEISSLNPEIANIGIINLQGEPQCLLSGMNKDINISDRQYYINALKTHSFAIGFFQKDRSLGTHTVNFAYPLLDAQQVPYGAVVTVITLDWWSQKLANFPLPAGAIAIITDNHNRIVANSTHDIDMFGKNITQFGFSDTAATVSNIIDFDNKSYVIHTQQIVQDNINNTLNVYVAIPFNVPISKANQLFINTLIAFILMIVILCIFARIQLKHVVLTPLARLTTAIQELTKGDLPKQFSLNSDELNHLYKHFAQMAQTRLAAEAHVKRQHDELNGLLSALPDIYIRINIHGDVLNLGGQTSALTLPLDGKSTLHLRDLLGEEKSKQLLTNLPTKNETTQFELVEGSPSTEHIYEARISAKQTSSEYTVVLQDISQRKKAEHASNLASLVYANSSEGMVITDPNAVILDVNPAFCDLTLYRKDEVLGQPISILSSGNHKKAFYRTMWQAIEETGRWQGEVLNRRKDGELFTEWLTIDTVYDEHYQPYRRVAIFTDITEKKAADELIWHQTHFDHLTNLPNRVELKERLNQRLDNKVNIHEPLVIMLLDLDHFKDINDTLGHFYGDKLLKLISQRLLENITDIEFIARIGGDEFVIVHSKLISEEHIKKVAQDILDTMAASFELEGEEVYIAASIGIAIAPNDGDNCEQLLKAADQAMFQAKQSGRNCYKFFNVNLRKQAQARMELLKDIRNGIEQQEFALYYQPIVNLNTGKTHKAEALIRWQHPVKGLISPVQFIPLAEESRYINPLGQFVFTTAIDTLKTLRSHVDENFQLSINVSPVQFSCLDSGIDQWPELLKAANLPLSAIVAEITEGLMITPEPLTQKRLKTLEHSGMELALDDFGTGYSSLAYLQQMDADYLKIDKCFVDNIKTGNQELALCRAIITMAHQFNLKVIAEGIETQEQYQLLLELGCDYGQGYLFSKPLPKSEFISFLHK